MPIYEYECLDCHQNFEQLVSISQKEAVVCPYCKSCHLNKQLSTFGTKFSRGKDSNPQMRPSSSSGCGTCTSRNCSSCR
ncbi:MAG: zinc ribbon domain-containing protein [bacterium]|nr:zinc ribbon domain-containing protein [bacterium]